MINNYHYIGDFDKSRESRLGSSDVAKLFVNPEKPTESLAGYNETAITLYNQKTGKSKPFVNNYSTRIGHTLEDKALEFFIERFFDSTLASTFRIRKQQYENDLLLSELNKTESPNPELYQEGLFRHNTEYIKDGMIVHPDCIYTGDSTLLDAPKNIRYITVEGVTVDKGKPFYIEAKSAKKESTKRPKNKYIKGYDFSLTNWQGIPLKHYVQMQYQSALYEIDTGYLPLLSNTSDFQVWRVDRDKIWQKRIINTVGKMLQHIKMKIVPKDMAICQSDIISIYNELKGDFINVIGEESDKIIAICREFRKAKRQIDNWKSIEQDCKDALSVYLKDYDSIMSGSDILVKWKTRTGSKRLAKGIKVLEKDNKNQYRYLIKHGLIKQDKDSRSIDVKYKE